jgi:hypothetical protein
MRPSEAARVGALLGRLELDRISPCINLGSSTAVFRRDVQPHIDQRIFAPLARRGVDVVHVDMKHAPGVDVVGDIYDEETRTELARRHPRLVLCCNMFEHVTDRELLADTLRTLVAPGGYLLVTVPRSYPVHYDPIDTYYRPSPDELAVLFPGFNLVDAFVERDTTYLQDLLAKHGLLGTVAHFLKSVPKLLLFAPRPRRWISHFHHYLWLCRPYEVSGVLLQRA